MTRVLNERATLGARATSSSRAEAQPEAPAKRSLCQHSGKIDVSDSYVSVGPPTDPASLKLKIPHNTTTLRTGVTGLARRRVKWQVPEGSPPPGGWPTAIVFHGSFSPVSWRSVGKLQNGYVQTELTRDLLEAGFAVLTPESHLFGLTFWETNVPVLGQAWKLTSDHHFMLDIFKAIEAGTFGPLDPGNLMAAGISSGGYMTSRMALAYRGRFQALAIHSGGYATKSGPIGRTPEDLPDDHPPTLFLHGEKDCVVPFGSIENYAERLEEGGTRVRLVTDPNLDHAWLRSAPSEIIGWFQEHVKQEANTD